MISRLVDDGYLPILLPRVCALLAHLLVYADEFLAVVVIDGQPLLIVLIFLAFSRYLMLLRQNPRTLLLVPVRVATHSNFRIVVVVVVGSRAQVDSLVVLARLPTNTFLRYTVFIRAENAAALTVLSLLLFLNNIHIADILHNRHSLALLGLRLRGVLTEFADDRRIYFVVLRL